MPSLTRRRGTYFGGGSSSGSSRHSDDSYDSNSTAPTSLHGGALPSRQRLTAALPLPKASSYDADPFAPCSVDARTSTATYASTLASVEELREDHDVFDLPADRQDVAESDVRPSSPSEFAECFPTTRRLFIKHDDMTSDGNMNLRVDTKSLVPGEEGQHVQLFHMRMHDLRAREFSVRRYCRDSGREVCHSTRKYTTPPTDRRPVIQRSVSAALASFRGAMPDMRRANSGPSPKCTIVRRDSGYASCSEVEDDDVASFMSSRSSKSSSAAPTPTNAIKLEFSNYAQLEMQCRGPRSSKHHDFQYWGTNYSWRRTAARDASGDAPSYQLISAETGRAVAHIAPDRQSPTQMQAEEAAGGWVPPCQMWITDQSVLHALTDVAEYVFPSPLLCPFLPPKHGPRWN